MARYVKTFPVVDSRENSFAKIQQYMQSKKYKYRTRDGEQVFQKGDGVWVAAKFIKVAYRDNTACLEAWVDAMGAEQGLEGFVASAAKKPLKKDVEEIEKILSCPNPDYVPGDELAAVENPAPPTESVRLPEGITKKEYFKKYAGESFNRDLKIAAIVAYVCAGLNAVISLVAMPLGLIDSAILLGLALGMHLGKSKGCAIAMLVYAIFTMVIGMVLTGTISGWLWLVAGIVAVIAFKNAEKRYKKLTENQ